MMINSDRGLAIKRVSIPSGDITHPLEYTHLILYPTLLFPWLYVYDQGHLVSARSPDDIQKEINALYYKLQHCTGTWIRPSIGERRRMR